MEQKIYPLPIPKRFLVLFSGLGIALLMGAFKLAYAGGEGGKYLWFGIGFSFVVFILVVRDLYLNPIKNKFTWAIVLTMLSVLGAFFYLLVRDRLLGIEENK